MSFSSVRDEAVVNTMHFSIAFSSDGWNKLVLLSLSNNMEGLHIMFGAVVPSTPTVAM
jgi:hypothetical protein